MSTWYVVGGIVVAMVVTFFTRIIPFPLQTRLANGGFLREFSRWMPLGAMVILFAYACSTIPAGRWLPYVVALAVTMLCTGGAAMCCCRSWSAPGCAWDCRCYK